MTTRHRFVALCLICTSSLAQAESGRLNLNVDLGLGAPFSGKYGSEVNPFGAGQAYGGHLLAALDLQIARPFAIELAGSIGFQVVPLKINERNTVQGRFTVVPAWFVGIGPRLRFLDTSAGNLWISLHGGLHGFDGLQFGLDLGLGYQFSIGKTFGIGPFIRGELLAPNAASVRGTSVLAVVGLGMSFDLVPIEEPAPADTDGDGLTDDAENQTHHTDPLKADTDGDGLNDGLEVQTGTNPLKTDTDGDGLPDGLEDANRNGRIDQGETDPRVADTDGDGLSDGVEDANHDGRYQQATETDPLKVDTDGDGLPDGIEDENHNGRFDLGETDPRNPDTDGDELRDGDEDANHNGRVDEGETDPRVPEKKTPIVFGPKDTDGDGVPDDVDNCPNEKGLPDNQGCPALPKQLVVITKEKLEILEKVFFETGKATIQKKSFGLLDQVANVLSGHPEIQMVQIEGHTDNVGGKDMNQKLSQNRAESVKTYLVGKGVAIGRLKAVGFGQSVPADVNTTPAGRERNRRVEFKIQAN